MQEDWSGWGLGRMGLGAVKTVLQEEGVGSQTVPTDCPERFHPRGHPAPLSRLRGRGYVRVSSGRVQAEPDGGDQPADDDGDGGAPALRAPRAPGRHGTDAHRVPSGAGRNAAICAAAADNDLRGWALARGVPRPHPRNRGDAVLRDGGVEN